LLNQEQKTNEKTEDYIYRASEELISEDFDPFE
jgi:hypothetical protein